MFIKYDGTVTAMESSENHWAFTKGHGHSPDRNFDPGFTFNLKKHFKTTKFTDEEFLAT